MGSPGQPRGTSSQSGMHPGPDSGSARDCGTGMMAKDNGTTAGDGPLLRLERITKRFGDFTALDAVSLDVERGEFVVFLGPSGCGKTTLLRIIAGLEPQTGGLIHQDGHEISALPPGRRDYGIVFQSYALFPNLTVFDNVAYGLKSERRGKRHVAEKVAELLDMVGLPGEAGKYPGQLSGGQQQRIAVARAIAVAPGLLLLDEPLSALDARVRVHLRHELKRLQRRLDLTTVMVTHDQAEALTLADRIVVMNHGVIEQIGSPPEIYRRPTTPFVADFVGTMNFLPGVVAGPNGIRLGDLDIACAVAGLVEGEAVTAAVRSEDVLLSGADREADNRLRVVVVDVDFIGSYYRCVLSAAAFGEVRLTADFPVNFMRGVRVEPGAEVSVTIPEDAVHVFSRA